MEDVLNTKDKRKSRFDPERKVICCKWTFIHFVLRQTWVMLQKQFNMFTQNNQLVNEKDYTTEKHTLLHLIWYRYKSIFYLSLNPIFTNVNSKKHGNTFILLLYVSIFSQKQSQQQNFFVSTNIFNILFHSIQLKFTHFLFF